MRELAQYAIHRNVLQPMAFLRTKDIFIYAGGRSAKRCRVAPLSASSADKMPELAEWTDGIDTMASYHVTSSHVVLSVDTDPKCEAIFYAE